MPSPNWTMSRTAAPMQLPRSAASREVAGGGIRVSRGRHIIRYMR